jgi:hypothetical protein
VETIVSGATDHVISPRNKNVGVATVESKQSSEDLTKPADEAQFLAELTAEFKKISRLTLFKPSEMCGAITNGVSWEFARRFIWHGEYLHYARVTFPTGGTRHEINKFFESVASFLIHMMEVSLEIVEGISSQYALLDGVRLGEEDAGVGSRGGEGDDEQEGKSDQGEGPDGGFLIPGQASTTLKRPYCVFDDDSRYIVSLTTENLKKYAIRG